ncbi:hypothetical protein BDZ89DRAFT_715481 [Hymenopellis radicata]|nr:hypothetical protein BDZ89DRAFT_715481 [Hymenopellis radicata]
MPYMNQSRSIPIPLAAVEGYKAYLYLFSLSRITPILKMLVFLLLSALPLVYCGYNAKRGLAFADGGHAQDLKQAANGAPSWVYNWSSWPPAMHVDGITPIPMQWGRPDIENFASRVKSQRPPMCLGFNEPDLPSQSNIDPYTAATLWKQNINSLAGSGVKLGSPAISSAPSGKTWMTQFLNACNGCTIDFLAIHWYGEGVQNFIAYVQMIHATFPGRSICVTEFAETRTDPTLNYNFMIDAVKFLDGASYVQCYALFAFGRNANGLESNMISGDGRLNTLGTKYVRN